MSTEPQPFNDSATLLRAFSDRKLMSRLFRMWKKIYGKTYSSKEEERYRRQIFIESARCVYETNTQSGRHHTAGLNHFADLTPQESRRYYGRASSRPRIS